MEDAGIVVVAVADEDDGVSNISCRASEGAIVISVALLFVHVRIDDDDGVELDAMTAIGCCCCEACDIFTNMLSAEPPAATAVLAATVAMLRGVCVVVVLGEWAFWVTIICIDKCLSQKQDIYI